jgi:hypothetical protein
MDKISRYLEDKRFIQWVYSPNDELEEWWESFSTDYPSEKKNIQLARSILVNLRSRGKEIAEEDKILMFSKILQQIEEKQEKRKKYIRIGGMLKYAAVAIIFFGIGALLFYEKENQYLPYYSHEMVSESVDNEARLIRPDGESILLQENNSLIEYNTQGQVVVNNNVLNTVETGRKGTPELNQLFIPYGKTSEIVLPDGTRVFLNAGSRLIYPEFFNDKNREVFLVGEAFFEVKKDEAHPFIVQTNDIRLKVLGTKFNVSAYASDNSVETVLTEGKVSVEPIDAGVFSKSTILVPNQMASFNRSTKQFSLKMVDTDYYTLWKEGILKFESTDLSRIIKRLERYYNVRFFYEDPFVGTVKISGKLDLKQSMEETLSRVASAASVNIEKRGKKKYEIN